MNLLTIYQYIPCKAVTEDSLIIIFNRKYEKVDLKKLSISNVTNEFTLNKMNLLTINQYIPCKTVTEDSLIIIFNRKSEKVDFKDKYR